MGGSSLPTPSTPGYTTYTDANGTKWTCCTCLAQWLPWFERVLKARGLIKNNIDIWQLTGGAKASGNTHSQGGAFDLLYQTSPAHVAVAREMGAPGTWGRKVSQDFARDHTHGVLSGCPHNGPAAYQITAQKRGYNGLGQGYYNGQLLWGYGHKDEFPDPTTYRTWKQGIDWAKAEVARLTQEEDPLAGITVDQIVQALLNAPIKHPDPKRKDSYSLQSWVTAARIEAGNANARAAQLVARVGALEATVRTIQKNPNVTADQISAAAKAGAEAALAEKITDAAVTLSVAPQ